MSTPGIVKTVYPQALAVGYVQAWAAKVPTGTQMMLAKMKCALADGPCGCAEDSTNLKCTGPYLPVPIEVLIHVLEQGVEGVQTVSLPSPQAVVEGGHVHLVEFMGPGQTLYVKKL